MGLASRREGFSGLGKGTYVLVLHLTEEQELTIGRLGAYRVQPGFFAYVGSALGPGGLSGRLNRHLFADRRPHWHVDRLLAVSRVSQVWYGEHALHREHEWAAAIGQLRCATIPVPRFGATDCRCRSHLFRFARPPSLRVFRRRVRERFPDDPVIRCVELGVDTTRPRP